MYSDSTELTLVIVVGTVIMVLLAYAVMVFYDMPFRKYLTEIFRQTILLYNKGFIDNKLFERVCRHNIDTVIICIFFCDQYAVKAQFIKLFHGGEFSFI